MKLGFAAFQFIAQATRRRFYPTGRPIRDTLGRPIQFFTHHPQPNDFDAEDPLGWLIPRCREMGFDALEASLEKYLAPAEVDRVGNLLAKHGVALATDYGDDFSAPVRRPRRSVPTPARPGNSASASSAPAACRSRSTGSSTIRPSGGRWR